MADSAQHTPRDPWLMSSARGRPRNTVHATDAAARWCRNMSSGRIHTTVDNSDGDGDGPDPRISAPNDRCVGGKSGSVNASFVAAVHWCNWYSCFLSASLWAADMGNGSARRTDPLAPAPTLSALPLASEPELDHPDPDPDPDPDPETDPMPLASSSSGAATGSPVGPLGNTGGAVPALARRPSAAGGKGGGKAGDREGAGTRDGGAWRSSRQMEHTVDSGVLAMVHTVHVHASASVKSTGDCCDRPLRQPPVDAVDAVDAGLGPDAELACGPGTANGGSMDRAGGGDAAGGV